MLKFSNYSFYNLRLKLTVCIPLQFLVGWHQAHACTYCHTGMTCKCLGHLVSRQMLRMTYIRQWCNWTNRNSVLYEAAYKAGLPRTFPPLERRVISSAHAYSDKLHPRMVLNTAHPAHGAHIILRWDPGVWGAVVGTFSLHKIKEGKHCA